MLAIESLDLAPFAAMQQAEDWAGVARVAVEAAQAAQGQSGAEGLLLASNTLHKVARRDRRGDRPADPRTSPTPTADRLVADGRSRVALLGTRFTMTEPFVRERYDGARHRSSRRSAARLARARSTASSTRSSPPAASSATASAS